MTKQQSKQNQSTKDLILTEKPSVGRDFAKALGNFQNFKTHLENDQYIITWAVGHLLTPFDPEDYDKKFKKWSLETLPIWIEDFKYRPIPTTKTQLKAVLGLLKRSDLGRVIVATDAGREGELIGRLILNEVKLKIPMFRFFTSEALTSKVIERELSTLKPLTDFDRLYRAGLLRQKLDWLMGMNLSRCATLKMGDLFSIGRVQTAVLSLIVKRYLERKHFKPEEYFELTVEVKNTKNDKFSAHWFDPAIKENSRRLSSREKFDQLTKSFEGNPDFSVMDLKSEKKTQRPYGIFSLTDLQRKANVLYGFPASKTLSLAQDLYEKDKCLSYPRTDSKFLAKSSFGMVKGILETLEKEYPEYFKKFDPKLVQPNHKGVFNDEKLTDHHGLIPLKVFKGNPNSDQGKIYELVLKELVANFSKTYEYQETKVVLTHVHSRSFYEARGVEVLEIGYKYLEGKSLDPNKLPEQDMLPSLKEAENLQYKAHEVLEKKTQPPAEYTEASLLYDMTNPARLVDEADMKRIFRGEIGLGTQATRANIIETLIKRGYIKRAAKSLIAEEKGITLIHKLAGLKESRDLTSVKQTAKMELILEEIAHEKSYSGLENESLQILKKQLFSSIEEWKGLETIARATNSAGSKYSKFSKKGTEASESLGTCPVCEKGEVREFFKSFSCERWKEGCTFSLWKVMSSKKMTEAVVKTLIKKRVTAEMKGFKSKTGKPFAAKLILTKENKIEFQFKS